MSLDPVDLSVLVGRLRSVCDEMGAVLIRSAHSPNIKERRDCSTALFNTNGELVMQAEHIPVHLGSMPDAVAAVLGESQEEGVAWILNDPFRGGTHLPDMTLITPVFAAGELFGFAATRAHHADVGGEQPGSMPADSTRLDEEGIVIPPTRVASVDDTTALADGMRNRPQRVADLRAQWAANATGAKRVGELIDATEGGAEALAEGMADILDYAERRTRKRIAEMPDGEWTAQDSLEGHDGDIELDVTVRIAGDSVEVDFEGSAGQYDGNLNCPLPVTKAATLFVMRTLIDPDAPPCAGCNRPISIEAPAGSVLNAESPAAVAGGNVETSSRVADLVMTAMAEAADPPAQGQGTMNNVTLGGDDWSYYETLGGGQGACRDAAGPDAIHVAMSNTLNTPTEALETELPVRVAQLAIRRGSGGSGQHDGGNGLIREIEALEPMSFSLITERRRNAPLGRDGGEDGEPGRNSLNGKDLPGKVTGRLEAGDRLRIETPGGGGFGLSRA